MAGRRGRRLGSWACRTRRCSGGLGGRAWDWRWGPWVQGALAAARRRRAVFEAWAAGAGRAGAARAGGVSIPAAGRWLHDTRMSTPARPVAAVESAHGGEVLRRGRRGGAGRPSDHRGPDARVSGRAGRGLRLGAAGAGHDRHGPGAGGLGPPSSPPGIGRCRQTVSGEIRRGAGVGRGLPPGGGAGRGPGAVGPPQDPQAGANPALRERVVDPPGGSGPVPGRIAARLRFENPDDGSMRICHEQIHPGARVRPGRRRPAAPSCGWRGPCAPDAPAAHPRSPLAGEARAQGQGAGYRGATISLRPPQADEGAVPGHWEADPIIAGRPPAAP